MEWWIIVIMVLAVLSLPVLFVLLTKLYFFCTYVKCNSQKRLDGKNIIVTGSNSGIGKETARILASYGARIIMACRNTQSASEVADAILRQHPNSQVVVKKLDLCNLESVRSFCQEILSEEPKIDILINNAGITGGDFKLTEDGFEEIYQANYLGPFYLTELLLPLLKKSAPARIINTGSASHLTGSVDWEKFRSQVTTRNKSGMARYGDSKLAMNMWTQGLADELEGQGVTINVVHPGVITTPIASKNKMTLSNMIFRFNTIFLGRTPEQGAQTLLHLSFDDEGDRITGQYWSECRPSWLVRPKNKENNTQLLRVTREILGIAKDN